MIGTDSREIERELIGAATLAPDLTAHIQLTASQFTIPTHGAIWEGIRALHQRGIQPTPPLIADEAKPWGRVDHGYVVELYGLGIAANADTYAAEILEAYDNSQLLTVSDRIRQQVLTQDTAAETVRDDARTALDRIGKRDSNRATSWADIEPDIIDLIQHGGRQGLHTPWPDLDRYIHGLVGSRCYFIAARPGEGKSLMAQGLATYMATRHRKTALYASLEMSREDLGIRIVAAESGLSLDVLQSARLTEEQWGRVGHAQSVLANMPLEIDDTPNQTMAHIRSRAVDLNRSGDLGLVAIDYVTLVTPSDERMPRQEQVAKISRDIKLLSRELDVPVVALTQLNRDSLKRQDKRPTIGDLRESGAQEQDADIVILMNKNEDTGELHVQVGKNRHGPIGNLDLQMWGHRATLRSVSNIRSISA